MEQQHTLQPKLRFPEFEEKWNSIKLGDLMTFKNGVNASKENYGFGYKFINVLDIINNNIITNDIIIGEVSITEKEFEKNIVQYGDILFQRSSETREEVGQSNVYLDETPATFGGFVIRGKSISEYNSLYLHYLLKTSKARLEITTKSGGSTRFNVGQETLSNVVIKISPSLPEQQKIADYLSTIDTKINLLEEKKAQLALYKKAMMQKLFSQEIRFKPTECHTELVEVESVEVYPEWEEKRLGEVCQKTSSNLSANQIEDNHGIYKLYGAVGLIQMVDFYQEDKPYISIVKDGAGVGRVLLCDEYSSVLGTLDKISPKDSNNLIFIYYLLLNLDFTKYVTGSTIPHIYFKDYSKEKLCIPSLLEQQKIADFLSAIDESIEKVNEQIMQTQSFKKAMLQQMFV